MAANVPVFRKAMPLYMPAAEKASHPLKLADTGEENVIVAHAGIVRHSSFHFKGFQFADDFNSHQRRRSYMSCHMERGGEPCSIQRITAPGSLFGKIEATKSQICRFSSELPPCDWIEVTSAGRRKKRIWPGSCN